MLPTARSGLARQGDGGALEATQAFEREISQGRAGSAIVATTKFVFSILN
jgi:hypothetical protein